MIATIAQVLGVKEAAGSPLQATLHAYLRDKRMLLVLDNFEQVIAAAPLVTDLLMNCPLLKVIVTSREVLRLRGEQEFLVPLLSTPVPAQTVNLDKLAHYAAVELFVQRAQAVKADFALDAANAAAVAELCARLDGLPLAIELAAARMKVLTPQTMLTRLDDRFKLLRAGARDLPDRQRTLQATLEWSYELLTEDEKTLFRRLAVFMGGCTLEAVEQVCNPLDDQGVPPLRITVVDGLTSLLDKSLLRQETGMDGESRFMMLATIYEYATARLTEHSGVENWHRRHVLFYLALAEQAELELRGGNQKTWLDRLETEHDNLRMSLHRAEGCEDNGIGLRLGSALWRFWDYRGHVTEGRKWLQQLLNQNTEERTSLRANVLSGAGTLARRQGEYAQAITYYREALVIREKSGDRLDIARTLHNLGSLAQEQTDYTAARTFYEKSLSIMRELGGEWDTAASLTNLGNVEHEQGNYIAASAYHEEALNLFRRVGDKHCVAIVINNLGNVAHALGNFTDARSLHEESVTLQRELENKWGIALALNNLGNVANDLEDYTAAQAIHNESLAIRQELGDKHGIASSLKNLGDGAYRRGDYANAFTLCKDSLMMQRELEDYRLMADTLETFAKLALLQRQTERAALLFGAAHTLRDTFKIPVPLYCRVEYEHTVEAIRKSLGENMFTDTWAAGQVMTLKQVIDYTLTELLPL